MSGGGALGPLLVDAALKGAVLLVVGALCAVALRRRSAAQRHVVWWVALVGLLALPPASALLPAWRVPALSGWLPEVPRPGSPEIVAAAGAREPVGQAAAREPVGRPAASEPAGEDRVAPLEAAGGPASDGPARGDLAAVGPRPMNGPDVLAGWALAGWAAGALLVLLGLAAEAWRVARLGRRARPVPADGRLAGAARRMARRIGIDRIPRLRIGDAGAMPMTWGARRPVILLPPGAEGWSDARLEAVLLHELAHVRRRDYLTQVVATVACALHWFDPLAWLALGRLRRERELACDDEVLAAGSRPSGYASELLDLARGLRAEPATSLAALAMARPSQLSGRLVAVLDETRDRTRLTRRLLGRAAAAGLLALLPLATLGPATRADAAVSGTVGSARSAMVPRAADASGDAQPAYPPPAAVGHRGRVPGSGSDAGFPAAQEGRPWLPASTPRCASAEVATSRTVNERPGSWTVRLRGDDCRFEFELARRPGDRPGDEAGAPLVLDPTFRRIIRLAPGTVIEIRSEDRGATRRLEARSGEDGRPAYRYWRDGEEIGFGADAAEWLAGALVPVLRHTGLQADERTRYILGLAGVDGVLEEVEVIGSDGVQKAYLLALLDAADLDAPGFDRVLGAAVASIGSDPTMRDFLVNVVARRPDVLRDGGLAAFREAAGTVGSDSEHRAMLLAMLDLQGGDSGVRATLLASAEDHIGSDSEMRRFLFGLAERQPSELAEPRYWSAARTIGSDSELRTVLLQLAESATTGGRALRPALEAARANIGSDSEMRTFLTRLVAGRPGVASGVAADAFWGCVGTIGSDSELSRTLLALADEAGDPAILRRALEMARAALGSDGEMSRFLVAFARRHRGPATGALRDAYVDAARTIGSDSERERALAAIDR